ncbi:WD40/YVTN/BNR-like repeat-containing protein [Aeromicrobium wangtongii]|uniref:WD40/YVTN/BNR-like repeat-containing protein n=1 Tax=Aeromicrobium wangtongii TaxID=2969247 RepID=UPI002017C906|nr:exo-alpha-sialidase [Aeromicrobium wangtongii]MCL3818919.1 exo-alpha-sialidase [Aeromicrobium wangtongii]
MTASVLLAGTRKGLFAGRSDEAREHWDWDDTPLFPMEEIYAAAIDTRGAVPRLLVGSTSWHYGPMVYRSDDLGRTWAESPTGTVRFPADLGSSVERVWQLQPSPAEPDVVWAGTQPSALFRSGDRGESFELVRSLWDHPHRPEWGEGFGGQAIHTIVPHPTDPDIVTVAMSTGGVYRSEDRGASWAPRNRGITTEFLPGEPPEFGQCVHKVAIDAGDPDRFYAQNHGGVFRSDDAGLSWQSISAGLPADFGFPMVAHPHRPGTIYVYPLDGAIGRFPPHGKPAAWRSTDAGDTWEEIGAGLPPEAWTAVLRDGFSADRADPAGLYIGTRHGSVWASNDEGGSWAELRTNLPDVLCIRAAVV